MRVIPENVPTVESLRLPPVIERIAHAERGMVLVTGVTGSGKSSHDGGDGQRASTATYEKHIVTLENPIEFLHADIKSSITQREIGIDTEIVPHGAARGAAPGPRRDPDRRDARSRKRSTRP